MKKWYCYNENGGLVYRPYNEYDFRKLVGRYCRLKHNIEYISLEFPSLHRSSKHFAEGSLCVIKEIEIGENELSDNAVLEVLEHEYNEQCFIEQNAFSFNMHIFLLPETYEPEKT